MNIERDIQEFMEETGLDINETYDLYNIFFEEFQKIIDELEDVKKNKDYKEIKSIVHNIKGISGSYKAMNSFEISTKLDDSIRENTVKDIDLEIYKLMQAMIDEIEKIKNYFNSVL